MKSIVDEYSETYMLTGDFTRLHELHPEMKYNDSESLTNDMKLTNIEAESIIDTFRLHILLSAAACDFRLHTAEEVTPE